MSSTTPTPEEIALQLAAGAAASELRVRRLAREIVDAEDALKSFREPAWLPTLADELRMPEEPVTYSVDELLPRGANVLLAAQFKAGKTSLINNLARSFTDREPFLGRFGVRPISGRVALFNYEVGRSQYRRWLADVGFQRPERAAVLNLRGTRLPLHVPTIETWVVEWLKRAEAEVWIVDPFARASVGSVLNENDNSEVGRWLDILDVIKDRAGVSELILPVHTGRQEFEVGKERARGATRLDDWADVRWLLNKDDAGLRYFSATGRDVEYEECALAFDENTRRLTMTEGNRKAKAKESGNSVVLEEIVKSPGITITKLREAIKNRGEHIGRDRLTETLNDLWKANEIRREQAQDGRREVRHYVLDPIVPFEIGGAS